ncbi:MAG: 3-deoxy-D-manno-octulosonic acid transferase [Thermodesulfobacteriota bacterium]
MSSYASRSKLWMIGYSLLWLLALPFLALNQRIRDGWGQRLLRKAPHIRADVWIQAASVGEARLARTLLHGFTPAQTCHILVTSCTREGLEVIRAATLSGRVVLHTAFFPFDIPRIMRKALERWRPRCVLLLETELWPGLLVHCRDKNIPAHVVNGRMGRRTLPQYLFLQRLWQDAAPSAVHAIATSDARRFATLFPSLSPAVMSNIKFDTCLPTTPLPFIHNPLSHFFKPQSQLLVLGSVRREEEGEIEWVLDHILRQRPRTLIALFPRHLQRITAWQQRLEKMGLPWVLRSQMRATPALGTIILWDTMGELDAAYALARGVFVGGSLAPVGGQNFLEPLGQGVVPVIGPFWENFAWVGSAICEQSLVWCGQSKHEVAQLLLQTMKRPPNREKVHAKFKAYIASRQGGTAYVHNVLRQTACGNKQEKAR